VAPQQFQVATEADAADAAAADGDYVELPENGGKRKTRHQTPKRRRSAKKGRKGLSKKKTGSRK
jgi:hypothetical protein